MNGDTVRRPPVPPRSECRECQSPIVFASLTTGSAIPLDPMPNDRGNVAVRVINGRLSGFVISKDHQPDDAPGWHRMIPHHATCPERAKPAIRPADLPLF